MNEHCTKLIMKTIYFSFVRRFFFASLILSWLNSIANAMDIIQQETLTFDKCLGVIETATDRLNLTPQLTDEGANKKIALFELEDGILIISCDGNKNEIVVSSETSS